ncbi:MAG TPA: PA14 domain-containing protein, partial [Anaerolineae bacterium]|nr:PA14 domain-containing protein [Anaerolineae bacterium]
MPTIQPATVHGAARVSSGFLLAAVLLLAGLLLLLEVAVLADPAPALSSDKTTRGQAPGGQAPGAGDSLAPRQEITATISLPLVVRHTPESLPPNRWQGEYYANTTLIGQPVYTTQDERRIDYDWGDGGAPPGLPSDKFSIRWTGDWDLEQGEYTFFLFADDGVRLSLDGELLIDDWVAGIGLRTAKVVVPAEGPHRLVVEYFEQTGGAAVRLHWRRTDLYPQWKGDYYREPWVEFGWAYEATDSVIQFDWGLDAPEGLPADGFSVGWTTRRLFEPGTHRFFLYADEG